MWYVLCDEWAAILIVFCRCLLLIAICCRLEHHKKSEKSDFDLHLDEGMEQVRTGTSLGG